ncbi:hypothetical protein [Metamycoplasma alkalescens]|uniref:Uncharacterized protein n=2 Tax=Metamycoplasma alkalescens TaxID=45363 RepID=A0A318U477_9BACT|nr:hypothetical protein [Metamycoplasma alkalescens]PYF42246.1 hypothetical protein BCF88_1126 [Metamycoplasma alkalescens]
MDKTSVSFLGISLEDYNSSLNLMNKFFVPKKLLIFYEKLSNKEEECFINLAGTILNQINLLLGQRISYYISSSKNLEDFIAQVGKSRYQNLKEAIYEEIKFRLLSNSFPEFYFQEKISLNNFQKIGVQREFNTIENYLCPTAAILILNSGWNKLEIPIVDKLLDLKDIIENKQKNIESLIYDKQILFQNKILQNQEEFKQNLESRQFESEKKIDINLGLFKNQLDFLLNAFKQNELSDAEVIQKYKDLQQQLKDILLNELKTIKDSNSDLKSNFLKLEKELNSEKAINKNNKNHIVLTNQEIQKLDSLVKNNLKQNIEMNKDNILNLALSFDKFNQKAQDNAKQIGIIKNKIPDQINQEINKLKNILSSQIDDLGHKNNSQDQNLNAYKVNTNRTLSNLDSEFKSIANSIDRVRNNEAILNRVEERLDNALKKIENFIDEKNQLKNNNNLVAAMLAIYLYDHQKSILKSDLTEDYYSSKYKHFEFIKNENTYKFLIRKTLVYPRSESNGGEPWYEWTYYEFGIDKQTRETEK